MLRLLTCRALTTRGLPSIKERCLLHISTVAQVVDDESKRVLSDDEVKTEAPKLIFGDVKYPDMTPEQKNIVDRYQEYFMREGQVVLPNTGEDLRQREVTKMLERAGLKK